MDAARGRKKKATCVPRKADDVFPAHEEARSEVK
jgi:hypothetical protein